MNVSGSVSREAEASRGWQRSNGLPPAPRECLVLRGTAGDLLRHLVIQVADDRVTNVAGEERSQEMPRDGVQPAAHDPVGLRSPCHIRCSCRLASSSAAIPVGVIA